MLQPFNARVWCGYSGPGKVMAQKNTNNRDVDTLISLRWLAQLVDALSARSLDPAANRYISTITVKPT